MSTGKWRGIDGALGPAGRQLADIVDYAYEWGDPEDFRAWVQEVRATLPAKRPRRLGLRPPLPATAA